MTSSAIAELLKKNPALYRALMKKVAAEKSLYAFTQLMWDTIEPANPFVGGWVVEAICKHLEAVTYGHISRLLMNVPPGMMKSLLTDVMWPAWEWLHSPSERYICTSYSQSLTERDNIRFRQVITSDLYQAMWADRFGFSKDIFSVVKIGNDKTGWKLATSAGGVGTGERGTRVICILTTSMILTDRGLISIGEIVDKKLNVKVAGYDGENIVWQQIETWQTNPFRSLVKVSFSGGSLVCTEGHRIYTQRGYIPAEEIRKGDSVWSFDGESVSDMLQPHIRQAFAYSFKKVLQQNMSDLLRGNGCAEVKQQAMHSMRAEYLSPSISFSQDTDRDILQSQMPRRVESGAQQPGMEGRAQGEEVSTMQKEIHCFGEQQQEGRKILLFGLLRSRTKTAIKTVSILRKKISSNKSICDFLFKIMRWDISRKKNKWEEQPKLCSWGCLKKIPIRVDGEIQTHDTKTRQEQMYAVLDDKEKAQRNFSCSSHKLYEGGLKFDELNHSLPLLSFKNAWENKEKGVLEERDVISVEKIHEIHDRTYNLSVHPCHNFFADGILVKNCDDLHNVKDGESDVVRKSTVQYFTEVLPSRMTNPVSSAIVVIMQRVNEGDVSGVILSKDLGYTHLMLPMEFDADRKCSVYMNDELFFEDPRTEHGELLFPERFPGWVVERDKKAMGPFSIASQFQQSPVPRGGGIIKREYWQLWPPHGEKQAESNDKMPRLEYPDMDFVIASVDTAYTKKEESDYNALCILGLWKKDGLPKIMLMHCWQKRLDFRGEIIPRLPDETDKDYRRRKKNGWGMLEWTAFECARFKVDKLLIENKATGITLAQEMRKVYGAEKWSTQLINPKGDKVSRVYAIQHIFAEKMVYAPDRDWAEECINQHQFFPKGAHDDIVDAVSGGIRHLRDSGWALRREEQKAGDEFRNKYRGRQTALYDV